MPIVNYIREHRRFIQYASDEKLTANERLLWYALMEIFNQRADGNDWPDDFIRISNDRVLTLCPMGFDTMAKARNGLKQRGRIEFRAGDKNKANPAYRIIYFSPESNPKISDNMTDNMRGNTGGNTGGNTWDNTGGNIRDIIPNQNDKYNYTDSPDEEEDDEEQTKTDRAQRRDLAFEIGAGYFSCFGTDPYPAEKERLVDIAMRTGLSGSMICKALFVAGKNHAENPAEYAAKVLQDWIDNDVLQPCQVDEYQFLKDALSGRNNYGTGDRAEDIRRFDEARRKRIEENREAGLKAAEG